METKIRRLRKQTGDNIMVFCYKYRINPSTMSLVERRKLVAGAKTRTLIAHALDVTEDEIFDHEGLAIEE